MASSLKTLELPVHALQPGMYVSRLDRPWLETPYLLQGILIQSQEDIDGLACHCKHVHVDVEQSEPLAIERHMAAQRRSLAEEPKERSPFHGRAVYVDQCSVEEELPAARQAHEMANVLIDRIRVGMERDARLDMSAAQQAAEALRESIVRNPDALLLIARLKRTGQALYDQAISASVHLLALGRHLGLPGEELSVLGLGGLMMDIGKLRLPPRLFVPDACLDALSRQRIKEHVALGEEVLDQTQGIPEGVRAIVSQHHEREDGSGYPRGLHANQLSPYARMAAIVDSYEELVAPRSGSPSASAFQALAELRHNARWGLNPALVEQFAHCIGLFPVGSLVELTSGEVAIVLTHGRTQRFQPTVMVILDARKRACEPPWKLDLRSTEATANGVQREIATDLPAGAYGIDPARYYL